MNKFELQDKIKEKWVTRGLISQLPVGFLSGLLSDVLNGVVIFLVLGLLNSKLLSPLNLAWIKFGELLGRIIAPIVMAIIYFVIITPIGLFMRLIGKDLLNTKFSKDNSYWIKRQKNIGPMKRQF